MKSHSPRNEKRPQPFHPQRTGSDNPDPPLRSAVRPGVAVWVIEKENYGTKNYTQGFVKDILTSVTKHPRGIKVRLTDGTIGRVQWVIEE